MRAFSVLIFVFFTALIVSAPAFARGPFSVSGNVTDADAIPLPGAAVMLLDDNNMTITTTITDANGSFAFDDQRSGTLKISVRVSFTMLPGKATYTLTSDCHTAAHHVIIPDNETRFSDYILPGKGYIHGHIVRESDLMLMTGTVYLSNGKTFEVTSPLQEYLFEVGPGNYKVHVVCYDENGEKLASSKVEVRALEAENKDDVPVVDLSVRPVSDLNPGAMALALGLGLVCILALFYGLRRLI